MVLCLSLKKNFGSHQDSIWAHKAFPYNYYFKVLVMLKGLSFC